MPRLAAALLVTCLVIPAAAHNGEYLPPLEPPRIKEGPKAKPGVPTRPASTEGGTVTPDPAGTETPRGRPGDAPAPKGPRLGFGRDDARFTVEIWWEANRHRYLPATPELPLRRELVNVLLDAVGGESDTVRDRAFLALGRTGDIRAFARIRKGFGAESESLRASAIVSLGLLGDETASPLLRKLVADGGASTHLRTHAALSLGLLGNAEDAAFLREVLNEEWEANIRGAAALSLGMLRDAKAVDALGRILLGTHPLSSPERRGMRTRIGLTCLAARALGEVLTPPAYDYLARAATRGEPHTQGAAAMVLAAAPGTAGLPTLRKALASGNPLQLRQYALLGLAERGDPPAIEEARRLLASPAERNGLLGPFAAIALGLTRDAAHADTLLALLGERDVVPETRSAAALALGILRVRKTIPALEKLLEDEKHPKVAGRALLADALLGGGRAKTLALEVLEDCELPGPRRDAVTALGILAAPETAEILVKELEDSYHVNREAALALARVDPKRAATELTRRLGDPNVNAGRHAAFALGALLDRHPPGRLTPLVSRVNLLCGAPVVKACLYLENEYLYSLVWNF
ncbi:MAG: HEAT repeat domain-containing protein [Planctomycetota bacterium]|jgi:HEAT repeat protein